MGILQKLVSGVVICLAVASAFGQNFGDRRAAMMDYAQGYWAWVDGGKVGPVPKASDARLLMPTVGRMADPFGDAIITFAAMLEVDMSTAATRSTVEAMLANDVSLMASFRHYTLTGQLQSEVNSTLFHKHLHAFMQSIFDGTEWESDGTASFDGQLFKTPDLKPIVVGTVVPMTPAGTPEPYVPPTDLAPDVQDLINRLREWTHRLRLKIPPGEPLPPDADNIENSPFFREIWHFDEADNRPGFDCDDAADVLIAWLKKHAMLPEGVELYQLGILSPDTGHAVVVVDMFGRRILIDPQRGRIEVGPESGGYTREWIAAFLTRAGYAGQPGLFDADGDGVWWLLFYGEYRYGRRQRLFEDAPWFTDPRLRERVRRALPGWLLPGPNPTFPNWEPGEPTPMPSDDQLPQNPEQVPLPDDLVLPGGPQSEPPSVFE